jgi:hypothetical protein
LPKLGLHDQRYVCVPLLSWKATDIGVENPPKDGRVLLRTDTKNQAFHRSRWAAVEYYFAGFKRIGYDSRAPAHFATFAELLIRARRVSIISERLSVLSSEATILRMTQAPVSTSGARLGIVLRGPQCFQTFDCIAFQVRGRRGGRLSLRQMRCDQLPISGANNFFCALLFSFCRLLFRHGHLPERLSGLQLKSLK